MPEKKSGISDLMLERYFLKELPTAQMKEIAALLKQDADSSDKLKQLEN